MDNKYDIDKIMYLLGQEDAMEELDKFTKPHEFSAEYESEKMKMLKNKNSMDNGENKKSNGMLRKKFVVLIAAATATLAISLTALGVSKNLSITANRDEEAGTVTYDVKSDVELTEIPLINITPEYLPDGYLPLNGAPGKYALNGDPSTGEGILIYQNDYIYQPESYNISNVEETTIGGVKAYINSSEGMDYKYKIDLIFEKEGQIISVGGSCSLDELKKVAENIKFEVVPREFLKLYDPDRENDLYIPPVSSSDEVYVGPDIPESHLLNSGEEVKSYTLSEERPMLTFNKVKIMDKLPEINPNYFSNKEIHLIYLLDDEYIDNAYIAIFEEKMSNETGYYFKLE